MDVSSLRWNASISSRIPIRTSPSERVTYGTELLSLQQVPSVGIKSQSCPKYKSAPLSQMQKEHQMKTDTRSANHTTCEANAMEIVLA